MIPDSMAAAVSHLKVQVCLALEQAHADAQANAACEPRKF